MEQKQVVNISQTGPDMTLRMGAAPQIYNYQGFEYAVTDRQSFVAAVLKFGSKQNTVIACDEKDGTVEAVLDKTVETRQHDKVFLRLMHSDELRRWEAILDKPMDHKTFVKFLERQANPALDAMIAATKQLRFVTQMTGDFSFDDNNNYNFVFKVGDAEGTARLPHCHWLFSAQAARDRRHYPHYRRRALRLQPPYGSGISDQTHNQRR